MAEAGRPPRWKILLAFATIYFVWGSTFLAIRVGVLAVPPLLFAAIRFTIAGLVLYGWVRIRGTRSPSAREWLRVSLLGVLIFLVDYGCLFWAEQRVPSGIAAVVLATIPVFITLLDILVLGTHRLTIRLATALAVGVAGVAVLMNNRFSFGEAPIDRAGAAALLIASFSWSIATILTRKLQLPASKSMSAAAQMLVGGVALFAAAAGTGEIGNFHIAMVPVRAWLALFYLITAGSIVGFTAYLWLLHYESPTRVGTYAYINPVVAVGLGYFLGGETVGPRTLLGTLLVILSVIVITTMPQKSAAKIRGEEGTAGMQPAEGK
ncbi:MAG: EamA family transporter [Acidobacteria bacterium]|nr:EamA family transporter [Acidobacteriota bacterium]